MIGRRERFVTSAKRTAVSPGKTGGTGCRQADNRVAARHACQIQREQHQSAQVERGDRALRYERADEQCIHRQPRRAGHERRDHDGREPVARGGNGARRHDAGDRTREAREQRNKGAPGESDASHEAIEHERGTIGQALNQTKIVRDEDYGNVLFPEFLELLDAPASEDCVAYGEGFIDDQYLGVDVNRGRKREANVHAAGIFFNRPVDELTDLCKRFDARKCLIQFLAR